jgi:YggT family protein
MAEIGQLLIIGLEIFLWIILIQVAISWLIAFEVINMRNQYAARAVFFIEKITAPVYKPLRRFVPPIGGIDLSPIVIILGIYLLQAMIRSVFIY